MTMTKKTVGHKHEALVEAMIHKMLAEGVVTTEKAISIYTQLPRLIIRQMMRRMRRGKKVVVVMVTNSKKKLRTYKFTETNPRTSKKEKKRVRRNDSHPSPGNPGQPHDQQRQQGAATSL